MVVVAKKIDWLTWIEVNIWDRFLDFNCKSTNAMLYLMIDGI